MLGSIVATCKLNSVNPVAYIAETLEAIIDGHPHSRIDDLMPWHSAKHQASFNRVMAKRLRAP